MAIDRRDFMKGVGATLAMAGCKTDDGDSGAPEVGAIEHVVIVMMENRSFDHVFGGLTLEEDHPDVDGPSFDMTNPDHAGVEHPVQWLEKSCQQSDPPHSWNSSRTQMDGGTNRGFLRAMEQRFGDGVDPWLTMGVQNRAMQPVSYALADHYVLCDRWFASLLTSTWPNRLYLHGAQSQGEKGNDLPDGEPFSMPTIWDSLNEAGVDWGYYYGSLPMLALFGSRYPGKAEPYTTFFEKAEAGTLPTVCMVDPATIYNDDHPPAHPMMGQVFLATVHNALAASPAWNKTLLIITYDEGGGFHDHVAPPTAPDDRADEGFDQLGFRVPGLICGPWVRGGEVSHTQYDHSSVLAHLETMFGMPALTARDAAANDFMEMLDTDRMAANTPLAPAELPVLNLDDDVIASECEGKMATTTGWPELEEALVTLGLEHLDHVADMPEIAAYLMEKARQYGVIVD
jgi:phospholipase C